VPLTSRKIVFRMPSLVTDEAGPGCDGRAGQLEPTAEPPNPGWIREADPCAGDREVLKPPRLALVTDNDVIPANLSPAALQTVEASDAVVSQSLAEAVAVFESNLIRDALKSSRGNRAKAARLLNTTERILSYKVRRYGIDPQRFRG
jgi:Nif-specific regulatory protein